MHSQSTKDYALIYYWTNKSIASYASLKMYIEITVNIFGNVSKWQAVMDYLLIEVQLKFQNRKIT